MALQLWMPLMGDLRNQGLGNYSISTLGTLSWVSGKLSSQALKAGDGTQVVNGIRIEDTFTELLNGDYSVSVWVKPYGQHVHYNGSIFSSGNWNTANKRWAFGVSQDNTKVDVLCSNYNTYINCTVPVNEWTHLVCTCGSDRIVKLYKNGEYIASLDRSTANAFDSDNVFTCIGRESYANGYFSFNGAIQDFRLYNHCLSELEIKQLSQGLVLHYPLNRQGFGQENLATCATNQYNIPLNTSNFNYFWINGGTLEPNTTYTFSAEVEVIESMDYCTIFNYLSGDYTGTRCDTFPADGKRHSWTFTTSETALGLIGYAGVAGKTANHSAIYKNIKIEKGDKATPYIPRSNETLYTIMGLNGTTEYDCSGFCNNGIKNNSPTYSSDTAKYEVSTHVDGVNQTIQLPNLLTLIPDSIFTFNIWFKRLSTEPSSKPWETLLGGPSGFEIETCSANNVHDNKIKAYSWGGGTFDFELNEWNMLTMVSNGTNALFYLNGKLKLTGTYKALVSGNYFIGSWNTTATQNYKGYVSDARIYATALSADDVKSLYQNCATIDADGTIHGQIRS